VRHTTTLWRVLLISLIVLLSTSQADIASAGIKVWTSNGPEGGRINALAIDPLTPTTLYAGTRHSGVFKSTNGGGDWSAVNTGLTSISVSALAIDPVTPATLYAGTGDGVFKSTNGGENWIAVNTGLTNISALAIDPAMPTVLYAGTLGGVFKSTNGGENWVAVNTGLTVHYVFALAIDPATPTTLYAGTDYEPPPPVSLNADLASESVFKSTNGGESWFAVNTGLPEHARVHSLAIDPVTPATLYVGISVGGIGVYKSTDGGENWSAVNTGLPTYGNTVVSLAIDPVTPTTLYAGTDRHGVFKSMNGGENWNAVNTGLTATNIQALAIDPAKPTALYAGAAWDGVFKSTNGGGNWRAVNTGMPVASISALAIDPTTPTTLYAGTLAGVFKSTNAGGDWNGVDGPLAYDWVNTLVIDPATPTTLYAGIGGVIFVSTSAGDDWGIYEPFFDADVRALAIDPVTPTTVYAGIDGDGVFKKTSGGGWNPVNTGLSNTHVRALAIDPLTPSTLYAGTRGGVFKSTNGGGDWNEVSTGLTNSFILTLAIDPMTPTTLFAGTLEGVFKTTNGGENWSAFNTGLTSTYIKALAIDPVTPATLYAGTYDGGVFKSTNGGENWSAFNTGLTHTHVRALAIDPVTPTTLYAGTDGGGVFAIQDIEGNNAITIRITAQVATVDDRDNILNGAINVNDMITGTYTYNSFAADSNPLPTVGDYWHTTSPYGIIVYGGGFVFQTDPNNVDFLVEIVNDHNTPPTDNYLLRSYNNLPLSNGATVDHIAWQLDDDTATALTSAILPTTPPNLPDWTSIFGLTLAGCEGPGGCDDPINPRYFVRAHVTAVQTTVQLGAWHVATNGSDITGDGSEVNPFATIQHGIDMSSSGDTVLVYPGIYRETINFMGKNIAVGSLFVTTGDEGYVHQTIIDGNRDDHVVTFENGEAATARLSGFTIANGYAHGTPVPESGGGGVFCLNSSPTLTHLRVSGNEATNEGGGLYFAHCSATIQDVIVTNNLAGGGGGGGIRYSYGSVSLENVIVAHNSSRGAAAGIHFYHADGTVKNALIADNSGGTKGGGMHFDGCSPIFVNVTVVGNWTAGQGGGLNISFMSQPTLVNSIVWGNSPEQVYFDTDWPGEAVAVEYSDIQDGEAGIVTNGQGPVYWGDGNMDVSPRFVDVGLGNYHLADDSLCIGAGKAGGAPVTDIEGNPRPNPVGSNPDMGAYENPSGLPSVTAPANVTISGPTTGMPNSTYTFAASVGPVATTMPITYIWEASGKSPMTTTANLTNTVTFNWSIAGEKAITVTAANAAGIVSDTHVIAIEEPHRVYLPLVLRQSTL
jgi:photosystem II stability/assembly factor-like uncharacterized protein